MSKQTETRNELTLKWGTLKAWHFDSEKGQSLLKEYNAIGSSFSAMAQKDTARQKEDWGGKYVSKQEAKDYVLNYGNR